MTDEPKEVPDVGALLADAMALTVDGPATIFIRPRRQMTKDDEDAAAWSMAELSKMIVRQTGAQVVCILLPHDFDVMVAGEAELANLGLARIPLPEKAWPRAR